MFAPLFESERFQNEYKNFTARANKITNEDDRKSVLVLIDQLAATVRRIDGYHEEVMVTRNPSGDIHELRNNIQRLRQQIDTKLNAWCQS